MTEEQREEWRRKQLARLDDVEASALQLAAATGRNMAATLGRIRRQRAQLAGTAPALKVNVVVPAGATRQERNQAVIVAAAARIDEDDEGDGNE